MSILVCDFKNLFLRWPTCAHEDILILWAYDSNSHQYPQTTLQLLSRQFHLAHSLPCHLFDINICLDNNQPCTSIHMCVLMPTVFKLLYTSQILHKNIVPPCTICSLCTLIVTKNKCKHKWNMILVISILQKHSNENLETNFLSWKLWLCNFPISLLYLHGNF